MYMYKAIYNSVVEVLYDQPFRLEGDVPTMEKAETPSMLGGAPGFDTPQLPRPGQRVTRKNALRIEK